MNTKRRQRSSSIERHDSARIGEIYPPEVRKAHIRGDLHIHDLGNLSAYCIGWDLRDLLLTGFCGAPGRPESRPARHFSSALGQIVNFFDTLQGEVGGAQAFSNFDTLLAPFIRHDGLYFEEVKQSLQEFIFNVNASTWISPQTPSPNLTLDLQPTANLAAEAVVVGGELQNGCYGDFQAEMNIFNQAFLEVLSEGDAKGRLFTVPIPTYNITAEFDWDNSELEPLWEVTAKYGTPYFANFVGNDMSPEDTRSMSCRQRPDLRSLERRGGGLFGANPLTGSIGAVTINMPRLGLQAKGERDFFRRRDRLMGIAKASLEVKRKVLERFTERDLYPYTKFYLRSTKERFGHYWHNHFSTVGLVGVNEACLNLWSFDIGIEEGRQFAVRVLDHMRRCLQEFQEETASLYDLEAMPAEATSHRLARLDRQRFPAMRFANSESVRNGQSRLTPTPRSCPRITRTTSTSISISRTSFRRNTPPAR